MPVYRLFPVSIGQVMNEDHSTYIRWEGQTNAPKDEIRLPRHPSKAVAIESGGIFCPWERAARQPIQAPAIRQRSLHHRWRFIRHVRQRLPMESEKPVRSHRVVYVVHTPGWIPYLLAGWRLGEAL